MKVFVKNNYSVFITTTIINVAVEDNTAIAVTKAKIICAFKGVKGGNRHREKMT